MNFFIGLIGQAYIDSQDAMIIKTQTNLAESNVECNAFYEYKGWLDDKNFNCLILKTAQENVDRKEEEVYDTLVSKIVTSI